MYGIKYFVMDPELNKKRGVPCVLMVLPPPVLEVV